MAHWSKLAASTLVVCACAPPQQLPGRVPIPDAGVADMAVGDVAGADATGDVTAARHIIPVTITAAGVAADGACSLAEAIAASNDHAAPNGDCPAGTGDDVIQLPAGTFAITETLELTESVELRGAGRGETILSFAGGGLTCGVRLATAVKTVWLTSLTLQGSGNGAAARPGDGAAPAGLTGVCVSQGTLRVRHARITGFTAGGLHVEAPDGATAGAEVLNDLIDGNFNAGDGGGVSFVGAGSTVSIQESAIIANTSADLGGGVFAAGGSNANYIVNSTISGNVARRGGGVAAQILDLTYLGLVAAAVVGNRAIEVGGGLNVVGAAGGAGHAFTWGAIVAGNTADGDAAQANLNADWNAEFSCTYSIFYVPGLAQQPANFNDTCLYDQADAGLGPLMDMGGADHLPMYALLPGSPAIDAISPDRSTEPIEQRDVWNNEVGDPPLGTGPGEVPSWTLFGRMQDGDLSGDIGPFEFSPRWQTELLAVADTSAGATHEVVTTPAGWNHGAGTMLAATAAGAFVTYQVPIPEAARYAITAQAKVGADAGAWQLEVAPAPGGPYAAVGAPQDGYAAADDWRALDLGTLDVAAPGQRYFRFTVTGKNTASGGYNLYLDDLMVTKQ